MVDRLLQKIDIDNQNAGSGKSSTPYDLDLSNSGDEFGDATPNPASKKASATKAAGLGGADGGGGGGDTVEMEGWENLSVDGELVCCFKLFVLCVGRCELGGGGGGKRRDGACGGGSGGAGWGRGGEPGRWRKEGVV